VKTDWKPDEIFPTSKVVWNTLLCPVMPADPKDILKLFGLMRSLDHTHSTDCYVGRGLDPNAAGRVSKIKKVSLIVH